MINDTSTATEGRILAHRRILARLIATLPQETRYDIMQWIEQREVMRDGQEDPGAVPTDGNAFELAIADEFSRIAIIAKDRISEPD
ncbi:hypothetical protein [Paracoccus sp. JM45]|uniref:hypothetical protein n=1 Tax=Paracoccus sp. JM45 TaxID=2283626 RepID=UPI000E6C7ABE|nr:hypothetical protein [Paracoccus sp. JM45]RJE78487.1 hypothetical protein DWB67_17395 [Paracoccus sp. JM45]